MRFVWCRAVLGGGGGTDDPDDGMTVAYIISELDAAQESSGVAEGFNLDDLVTESGDEPGCKQADFVNAAGEMGIDNQLAKLAPVIEDLGGIELSDTIAEAIASGDVLILLELTDVDDFGDDGSIEVNFVFVEAEGGGMPTLSDPDCDPSMERCSIAGGQTFTPAAGAPDVTLDGEIDNGKLRISGVPEIPIAVDLETGDPLELNVRDATLEADISMNALENGVLGGSLEVDQLVTSAAALLDGFDADTIRQILEPLADIEAGQECDSISVGLVFEGVDATLN